MSQSASTVLMGSTRSNVKEVSNRTGVIAAGLAVHLKSDDTITTALADGAVLGISVGRDLSNTSRTAVARKGLDVPVLLTASFTPVIGAQVNISDTTGKAGTAGAGFTAVNAVYKTAVLTAIDEDGATITDGAAYIDFPGGL